METVTQVEPDGVVRDQQLIDTLQRYCKYADAAYDLSKAGVAKDDVVHGMSKSTMLVPGTSQSGAAACARRPLSRCREAWQIGEIEMHVWGRAMAPACTGLSPSPTALVELKFGELACLPWAHTNLGACL